MVIFDNTKQEESPTRGNTITDRWDTKNNEVQKYMLNKFNMLFKLLKKGEKFIFIIKVNI